MAVKKIHRDVILTFLFHGTGAVLFYMFSFIVAKLYGPKGVGILSLTLATASVFSIWGTFGTENSAIRFLSSLTARNDHAAVWAMYLRLLGIVLFTSLFSGLLLVLVAPLLTDQVFRKEELAVPLRWGGLMVPLAALLTLHKSALFARQQVRESVFLDRIFAPLLRLLGLAFFAFYLGADIYNPVYAFLLGSVGAVLGGVALWLRRLKISAMVGPTEIPSFAEVVSRSFHMMLGSSMMFILDAIDVLMLGVMRTTEDVGVYRIASRLAWVVNYSLVAVNIVGRPRIARLHAEPDASGLRETARSLARQCFYMALPFAAPLILWAPNILQIFGEKFMGGAQVIIVLVPVYLLGAASGVTEPMLYMTGHERRYNFLLLFTAALNVVLNLALIPRMGIMGAAVGKAVSHVFLVLAASLAVRRTLGYWIFYIPGFLTRTAPGRDD